MNYTSFSSSPLTREQVLSERPTAAQVSVWILRGCLDPSLRDWALTNTRSEVVAKLKPATYNGPYTVDMVSGVARKTETKSTPPPAPAPVRSASKPATPAAPAPRPAPPVKRSFEEEHDAEYKRLKGAGVSDKEAYQKAFKTTQEKHRAGLLAQHQESTQEESSFEREYNAEYKRLLASGMNDQEANRKAFRTAQAKR